MDLDLNLFMQRKLISCYMSPVDLFQCLTKFQSEQNAYHYVECKAYFITKRSPKASWLPVPLIESQFAETSCTVTGNNRSAALEKFC